MQGIANAIEDAATATPHTTAASRIRLLEKRPDELEAAIAASKAAEPGSNERRKRRRIENRLRRQWIRQRDAARSLQRKVTATVSKTLEVEGVATEDRALWMSA
eukprot:5931449-Karenia_brevis.AAC.1